MAMAAAINEDILEVDAMGIDFIQLDEFTWPYFYEDWAIEAFNRAVEGVQNAQVIVHVCWGNWGGTPAYYPDETAESGEIFDLTQRKGEAPSATSSVIPKSYEAKFDVLNLENCGRRSDDLSGLDVLKNHPLPDNVTFWAGVIDVKSTITETAEEVCDRILRLAEYVPPERLGVTTDCGLILLQRYIAIDKLHALSARHRDGAAEAGSLTGMAIWTLSCPACGHHFRSLVMEGTRVPQVWVCSACGSRDAAPVDVQEGGPFTAGSTSCGCGCG